MKNLVVLLTLMLAAAGVGQAQTLDDDTVACNRAVEYYYLQARTMLEQGNLDQCYDLLEHCRALSPSSSAILFELSSFYVYLNKDSIACDILERIVAEEPDNRYYTQALVNLYYSTGNKKAAIALYEDMLEKTRSKSDIYIALYSLYAEELEHKKAVEILERLEKSEGKSEEISMQKLRQYFEMPDSAKSVALMQELIEENPDEFLYQGLLGDVYLYFGELAGAERQYLMVLEKEPDDAITLSSLSTLYAETGNDSLYCVTIERLLKSEKLEPEQRISRLVDYILHRDDSVHTEQLFEELMQLPFDRVEILESYVQYLLYKEAPADRIKPVLEKLLMLEPENTSAMLQLLVYAIEANNYDEVIRLCDNAMMYVPELLELYYYKGLSYYLTGRKRECIDIYRRGLELRSEESSTELVSTVYAVLGDTYHELDMMQECVVSYDSALVYNPSNINVLNNYAYYLALDNAELERALDMSRKTITAEPDNPIYLDTYAWVLFLLERYEEAKAYAEKLIQLESDMSAVELHHCGDIFALCGDIERAVEFWKKAVESGDDSKLLKKKIRKRKYYSNAKRR